MYQVSVPLMLKNVNDDNREKLVGLLHGFDAKRVFFALNSYILSKDRHEEEMRKLREQADFFRSHGFEVGAWLWSFMVRGENAFTHMVSPLGKTSETEVCPSDEAFRRFAGSYLQDIARCGVDIILYDDDFRYGFIDAGMGCVCENHLSYMESILGKRPGTEELKKSLLSGGGNSCRDVWLAAKGHFLEQFAEEMRRALNEVNPHTRLGVCACISSWDADGTNPYKISRILAGETKPFLRLIGAPYWAVNRSWGNRLQNVIELERMERSWCDGDDIEILAEGDTFPRPRTCCPASYLEIYDTALRADGQLDGILKYGVDYTSGPDYETGYYRRHLRNKPLYAGIEKSFAEKTACGVRVYEAPRKLAITDIPAEIAGTLEIQNSFFSIAARMLVDNSISTTYEGQGVAGIAFGENVGLVNEDAMKRGIILDAKAARLLTEKGIDTGILSFGEKFKASKEFFAEQNEYIGAGFTAYHLEISDKARMSSLLVTVKDGAMTEETVGAFAYTNALGYRFFIFAFDAYFNGDKIYRSYARARQLKKAIEDFGGRLPAVADGNPDLYLLTKKGEGEMAVGLWNIFADSVMEPVIELEREYSDIRFLCGTGELRGNAVYLSEIPPFGFAGFVVTE